jgi:hypothetical protein
MKASDEHRNNKARVEAPKGLVDDLAALYGAPVLGPREVDEAIMSMARQRLARRRRPRLVLRWAWAGAAAAAAVLLGVWLMRTPERPRRASAPRAQVSTGEKEDFDGNGRVDILDAFALARRIESGPKPTDEWDFNGDGMVDREDVNRIAMAAVSLKRGT